MLRQDVNIQQPDVRRCMALSQFAGYIGRHRSAAIALSFELATGSPWMTASVTLKLNLNACEINKASLFPGIDGLAEHQSWLYKWGEHMKYGDEG